MQKDKKDEKEKLCFILTTMHHAYLYEGSQELLPALAADARGAFEFAGEHNPDVRVESFEKFGIEDAQKLKETASLRSVSGRSLYVVGIASITSEAQQALLKLFEEPQAGAIFVLLMPHGTMLPTLRSRFAAYPKTPTVDGKKVLGSLNAQPDYFAKQAGAFLRMNAKDRSAAIAALLKDDEGAKERVRDFLSALEAALVLQMGKSQGVRAALEDIIQVRSYVNDRSPALKMLLEHLALALPSF